MNVTMYVKCSDQKTHPWQTCTTGRHSWQQGVTPPYTVRVCRLAVLISTDPLPQPGSSSSSRASLSVDCAARVLCALVDHKYRQAIAKEAKD